VDQRLRSFALNNGVTIGSRPEPMVVETVRIRPVIAPQATTIKTMYAVFRAVAVESISDSFMVISLIRPAAASDGVTVDNAASANDVAFGFRSNNRLNRHARPASPY